MSGCFGPLLLDRLDAYAAHLDDAAPRSPLGRLDNSYSRPCCMLLAAAALLVQTPKRLIFCLHTCFALTFVPTFLTFGTFFHLFLLDNLLPRLDVPN
jgi:hypothetical protein